MKIRQVRIYSLAKELSIDAKKVVEQCALVGIEGKPSALASLTVEQAVAVAESFGKTYSPPSYNHCAEPIPAPPSYNHSPAPIPAPPSYNHYAAPIPAPPPIVPKPARSVFDMPVASARSDSNAPVSDRTYTPSGNSMSLGNALAIDALHAQIAEIGAIVESLILKILDTTHTGPTAFDELDFCSLIDSAFETDLFASLSADDLHTARMARNRIMHRANGDFPTERELRQSRNAFVLAALDLLEFCGEALKAEVLSDFKQHFPNVKTTNRTKQDTSHTKKPSVITAPTINQP